MKLPASVYERLPQFWLLLGVLFIVTGLLLGTEYPVTYIYFALGVACIFWSFCIVVLRPRKPEYTWTEPASVVGRRQNSEEDPLKQSTAQPFVAPIVDVSGLPDLPDEPSTDLPDEDN